MKLWFLKYKKSKMLSNIIIKSTYVFVIIAILITAVFISTNNAFASLNKIQSVPTYSFSKGSGTSTNPFQITSVADLKGLATNVNAGTKYGGKYFKLMKNLNLNNQSFTPIGGKDDEKYFSGVFDGNNFIIEGLNVNINSYRYAGLFGITDHATIRNLTVSGSVSGSDSCFYVAGIVGYAQNNTQFNKCANWCNVTNSSTKGAVGHRSFYAGGIVGCAEKDGAIFNLCKNLGQIVCSADSSFEYVAGGICGYNAKRVTKSFNSGNVTAGHSSNNSSYAGGICGAGKVDSISNCYNTGNITATASETLHNTYWFTLTGEYKREKVSTTYYKKDEKSKTDIATKHSDNFVYFSDTEQYTYGNLRPYNHKLIDLNSNYDESCEEDAFQKKYFYRQSAYAYGISYSCSSLSNCYNSGNISGGYAKTVYDFGFTIYNYAFNKTHQLKYSCTFKSGGSYGPLTNGTIDANSNAYYLTTFNEFGCIMEVNYPTANLGQRTFTFEYERSDSKEYKYTMREKKNHIAYYTFRIYTPEQDWSVWLSVSTSYKDNHADPGYRNIIEQCSSYGVFDGENCMRPPNSVYKLKGTEKTRDGIIEAFSNNSIWDSSPAINNNYPYIKEMYW